MLEKIVLKNYLLIENLEFDAKNNLSIFIGETGSGKSMFIDALSIILGKKFSNSAIGQFSDATILSAIFQVSTNKAIQAWAKTHDIECENELIITRKFYKSGKSTTKINGEILPVAVLKSISSELIDIHAQFDTQKLLRSEFQKKALDYMVDKKIISEYHEKFQQYKQCTLHLEKLYEEKNKIRELDYLQFQLTKLERYKTIDLVAFEELEHVRKHLEHAKKIQKNLETLSELSESDINGPFLTIEKIISDLALQNSEFQELYERVHELVTNIDDVLFQINKSISSFDQSYESLPFLNEIDAIYALQMKHGNDLHEAFVNIDLEIKRIEEIDAEIDRVQLECNDAHKLAYRCVIDLEEARSKAAIKCAQEINTMFSQLYLTNVDFTIDVEYDKEEYTLTKLGISTVNFLVKSNNATTYDKLNTVLSGGELSRIMLALKVVLSAGSNALIIFDEIDSGVSGKVAEAIGAILRDLSKTTQLFLITHSAIVASFGIHFYEIIKIQKNGIYKTNVQPLADSEINSKLATLISGVEQSDKATEQIKILRSR